MVPVRPKSAPTISGPLGLQLARAMLVSSIAATGIPLTTRLPRAWRALFWHGGCVTAGQTCCRAPEPRKRTVATGRKGSAAVASAPLPAKCAIRFPPSVAVRPRTDLASHPTFVVNIGRSGPPASRKTPVSTSFNDNEFQPWPAVRTSNLIARKRPLSQFLRVAQARG